MGYDVVGPTVEIEKNYRIAVSIDCGYRRALRSMVIQCRATRCVEVLSFDRAVQVIIGMV